MPALLRLASAFSPDRPASTGRSGATRRGRSRQRAVRPGTDAGRRTSWIRQLAFALAMVAQIAGIGLSLSEGRAGVGAGTHIEAVGTKAHYSHDETTCGACHLRSMHGAIAVEPRLAFVVDFDSDDLGIHVSRAPIGARPSSNRSRAPPTVI